MSDPSILCPHCGKPVEMTTALRSQLEKDFTEQFAAQEAKLKDQLRLREVELAQKEELVRAATEKQKETLAKELEKQLIAEKTTLSKQLRLELQQAQSKQFEDLSARLKEKEEQLQKADAIELSLRKKQREIEERERRQEIELQRRMDEMRKTIVDQTRKQDEEQANLRLQEKDKQLEQMKKTIQGLQQQSEQGSMQVQGDAAESSLKEQLQAACQADQIEDVATGMQGADLLQRVRSGDRVLGTIIWESKRTKVFSEPWLSKLKKDQTEAKADIAVLVTATLPKEITTFTERSGIWICGAEYAIPLALVLRSQIVLLAKAHLATQDRSTKTQHLYHYISGSEFRNRVEQLVVTFVDMQRDLDRESRALAVAIKRRQKQLESLIYGTAGMYGDLQGIIGGALPKIDQLELDQLELEDGASSTVISGNVPTSLFD